MPGPTLSDEVTFISGVNPDGTLPLYSYSAWNDDTPATYTGGYTLTAKFGSTTAGTSGGTVYYYFDPTSNWTATEQSFLAAGLALWSAVANITLVQTSDSTQAKITFKRGTDGAATSPRITYGSNGGLTGGSVLATMTSATISIDTTEAGFGPIENFSNFGGYPILTLLHEEGHALGLGHAGPYNSTVTESTQQYSAYDTLLYSIMSYIEPFEQTSKYYASYGVSDTFWNATGGYGNVPTTLMPLDILAIQALYGKPVSTPLSGGQVFGFHCNVVGAIKPFFDFTVNTNPIITIWDAGTANTLDISGFSAKATVDLHAGAFSSVNGLVNNIAIAYQTAIDSLVLGNGGSSVVCNDDGDTITGGTGQDYITGGSGNDRFNGGAGTDTVVLAGRAADYTVLVDGAVTTVVGTAGIDVLTGIEQVSFAGAGLSLTMANFTVGALSTVQALSYIASYTDLMGAYGDNAAYGARHYLNNGRAEGRTISFDALDYIASYGDLIRAFGDNALAGVEHYIKNGFAEGRRASFDALNYIASYGDLIRAFGDNGTAAEEHYIKNGFAEGRKASFDPLAYLCSYDDLMGAFGDNQTYAVEHYIKSGFAEGRTVSFNALAYIASYDDLIAAFGTNVTAGEEHYIKNGHNERRAVTFDPVAYLINNADLGRAGFTAATAAEHYIKNGYWEHRSANGAFGAEQTNHTLALGGSLVDAIGTAGDKDWFAVTVAAGQTYTFTLSGADGSNGTLADPFLSLCDAHGVLLTFDNDDLNHDAKLRFTAPTTGTIYLVASANDTGTGTYKLLGASGG
jgi:hypothetical protein